MRKLRAPPTRPTIFPMDISVVQGDTIPITCQLFDASGPAPLLPSTTVTFSLSTTASPSPVLTTTAVLGPLGTFTFTPTAAMVATPGVYRGRFTDPDGNFYPSSRALIVGILAHTRGHPVPSPP